MLLLPLARQVHPKLARAAAFDGFAPCCIDLSLREENPDELTPIPGARPDRAVCTGVVLGRCNRFPEQRDRPFSPGLPLPHPICVLLQHTVSLQVWRFCELHPDECHRIVMALPSVVLSREEFAESRVRAFRKCLGPTLGPFECKIMLPRGRVRLSDLQIRIRRRKIALFDRDDTFHVAGLPGEQFHHMSDPEASRVALGFGASRTERRYLRPCRVGELPVDSDPSWSKDACVGLHRTEKGVPLCTELPLTETASQLFRVGLRLLTRLEMNLLETLESLAHSAVGVVDRSQRLFNRSECVLRQLDDFSGIALTKKIIDGVDDFLDALPVVGGGGVFDELPGIHGRVDRASIRGHVQTLGA